MLTILYRHGERYRNINWRLTAAHAIERQVHEVHEAIYQAAIWRGSLVDQLLSGLAMPGASIPSFCMVLILIQFFAVHLVAIPGHWSACWRQDLALHHDHRIHP